MNKKHIVLLSGLLCDKTVWQEVAEQLSPTYDVSIIDFRGFNRIEDMAAKVLSSTVGEFILIGHSLGGRVALEVYNQQPKRVTALGLFNTGVHPRTAGEIPVRQKLIELARRDGIPAVCNAWLPPMLGKSAQMDKALVKRLENMVNRYSTNDYLKQIEALLNRPDASTVLAKITVPALLLSAEEDKWSPISQHEDMHQFINNSTLVEIKDAGHFVPIEKPKRDSHYNIRLATKLRK